MIKRNAIAVVICMQAAAALADDPTADRNTGPYEPTWRSLRRHRHPQWLSDAKFGIYTHWLPTRIVKDLSDFKAEKFDPDQWAELFKQAGARFAGPVAEHGGQFAMWDSDLTTRDAVDMNPHIDVVGRLKQAITKRDMKFMVSFHKFQDGRRLDGKIREVVDKYQPDLVWFDNKIGGTLDARNWGRYVGGKLLEGKSNRLGGPASIQPYPGGAKEQYRKEFLAYYFNRARRWGREVEVTYKTHDFVPGVGMPDIENGRVRDLSYHQWMNDVGIGEPTRWYYRPGMGYKSLNTLIDEFVDMVSKNGLLLLNVPPKADGTIPPGARRILLGMGKWLAVNGEAIYGTTPWIVYGEGPTELESIDIAAYASEHELSFNKIIRLIREGKIQYGHYTQNYKVDYTPQDVRFTVKGDVLYAICLGWPGEEITIRALGTNGVLVPGEVASVRMLGSDRKLKWELHEEGLTIKTPDERPCEHAFTFRIERRAMELDHNNRAD